MADSVRKARPKKRSLSDEAFEYRLLHDERFLRRIEASRKALRAGKGTRLQDLED